MAALAPERNPFWPAGPRALLIVFVLRLGGPGHAPTHSSGPAGRSERPALANEIYANPFRCSLVAALTASVASLRASPWPVVVVAFAVVLLALIHGLPDRRAAGHGEAATWAVARRTWCC